MISVQRVSGGLIQSPWAAISIVWWVKFNDGKNL